MAEPLELRQATVDDVPAVAAVLHRCFCTFGDFAQPGWQPPTLAWHAADFAGRLDGVAVRTRVAMVQGSGEAAGICGWMPARADPEPREPIPGLAHLWLLFVMPEHWGSRLASDLLAWAQAGMIDASYDAARLWTPVGQNRARAFYERRRWRPTAREQFSDDLGLQLVEYRVELG